MRCGSRSTDDLTLSSCCSEDDESNSSHELHGGSCSSLSQNDSTAIKLSGKSRSSRGPATDPQSLYARVSPFWFYILLLYMKHQYFSLKTCLTSDTCQYLILTHVVTFNYYIFLKFLRVSYSVFANLFQCPCNVTDYLISYHDFIFALYRKEERE